MCGMKTIKENRRPHCERHKLIAKPSDNFPRKKQKICLLGMEGKDTDRSWGILSIVFFVFITVLGAVAEVNGDELQTDSEVLLQLKSFLEEHNPINRGRYSSWNLQNSKPCNWSGIICNSTNSRVTGIDLSNDEISGQIFHNFSALTELSHLDLSKNTLSGTIPGDLNNCKTLLWLNLSNNILEDELNLLGLINVETLDLSVNRISGDISLNFPAICKKLVFLDISGNNFTGQIDNCFDECRNLLHIDVSSNKFNGGLWPGLARTQFFSVSENELFGELSPLIFTENCSLQVFDLSINGFRGEVPEEISNCRNLSSLSLWGNEFSGKIPAQIGKILNLQALYLAKNNFSREIPESLINLSNLVLIDMSKNNFGGDIQDIFGKLPNVKYLNLRWNSYTGGISSSGITKLPTLLRIDLSWNNFSGPLPVKISEMKNLKFLILAYNQFNESIPSEFGNLTNLQALDLSFNKLTGSIPSSFGNLTSLLWLTLASNTLTGEIPKEMGNCSSLLWINLSQNKLSGPIPSELTNIGSNVIATFKSNRRTEKFIPGSGECLAMQRWLPADYPPFSFVYTILTRKTCRIIWDRLLKGYGLFPIFKQVKTLEISGYVQLIGNQLSGEIPNEIGKMVNFSMLHLSSNNFSGKLPQQLGNLPLVVLNVSNNRFSGEIPAEIGNIESLQNLDLSYNNFSGNYPQSLNNLNELNKFNLSYNPLITGEVSLNGQMITFGKDSYLGNPLLQFPDFKGSNPNITLPKLEETLEVETHTRRISGMLGFLITFFSSFVFFFLFSFSYFLFWRD